MPKEQKDCLELLSLLLPQSVGWDGFQAATRVGAALPPHTGRALSQEGREYRKNLKQALRNGDHSAVSKGGGRKQASIGRDDVLAALAGVSELQELFVYGFLGMLRENALHEFEREAYRAGIADDMFLSVSFDEFAPVFAVAWHSWRANRVVISVRELGRMLNCGQKKAGTLIGVFSQSLSLINTLESEVCCHLVRKLFAKVA